MRDCQAARRGWQLGLPHNPPFSLFLQLKKERVCHLPLPKAFASPPTLREITSIEKRHLQDLRGGPSKSATTIRTLANPML